MQGFRLPDRRGLEVALNEELDFAAYGSWWVTRNTSAGLNLEQNGVFIAGLETPVGNIPVSGTASYSGNVVSQHNEYYTCQCASFAAVAGNVQMTADFNSRSISGLMTQLQVIPDWTVSGFMNDASFSQFSQLAELVQRHHRGRIHAKLTLGSFQQCIGQHRGLVLRP